MIIWAYARTKIIKKGVVFELHTLVNEKLKAQSCISLIPDGSNC